MKVKDKRVNQRALDGVLNCFQNKLAISKKLNRGNINKTQQLNDDTNINCPSGKCSYMPK